MFNKHVITIVRGELAAIRQQQNAQWYGAYEALPGLLYHPVNAQTLPSMMQDRALKAIRSVFAGEAAPDAYALPLIGAFLDERRAKARGRIRREFAEEVLRHFNPAGTHFDRYMARFFENGDAAMRRSGGRYGYALGLRSADMDITEAGTQAKRGYVAHKAIYCATVQRRILNDIYLTYEGYYREALDRFGEEDKKSILPYCWDGFRRAIGELLLRFRPPAFAEER